MHYPMLEGLDPFDLLDTEAQRLHRFFSGLSDEGWTEPTRCEGWRRREIVAHLASADTYHNACLDDSLGELFRRFSEAGATTLDAVNDLTVRERADRSAQEVLDEWWALSTGFRRRMRERGADATLSSSIGPYPVGLQGFHVASEYATHADDMGAPVDPAERAARTAWRRQVSLFALEEKEKPIEIAVGDGTVRVRSGDKGAELSDHDFVEAVTGRLPDEHPLDAELREALRALA